jgi:spermidine synthase
VGDGRAFIENAREPYDVIFLDAFGTRNVPPHLTTVEFMRAVKRAASPGGIVVWNIWGRGANPLYDAMVRTYLEVFEGAYMLDVPGTSNKILLASPGKLALDRAGLVDAARRTASTRGFQFDLADIAESQFHALTRKSVSGRVLRDAEISQPVGAAR